VIRWTLNNVVFDDGGMASGFFTVNTIGPDCCSIFTTDFDIKTTAGSNLAAFEYSPSTAKDGVLGESTNTIIGTAGYRGFQLAFIGDFRHATGGTLPIALNCTGGSCSYDTEFAAITRFVTSGTITAGVPEPSTYAFLVAAVGLLGFVRKRVSIVRRRERRISSRGQPRHKSVVPSVCGHS
jgi:hypothetical protein